MKKIILIILLIIPFASANIIITEVHYDPELSESDTEFVEIYNPGESVNISDWKLNTTRVQAEIPENTFLDSNTSFLIADEDDTQVWLEEWPAPDHTEEISLPNTDSGVQLLDNFNNIVDAVGWGNSLIFEAGPAIDVDEGYSLARNNLIDTDNNSFDFSEQLPIPQNSRARLGTKIELNINVESNSPKIEQFLIYPDESANLGIQILPNPGNTKYLTAQANITDFDQDMETPEIWFDQSQYQMQMQQEINTTTAQYSLQIPLNYYLSSDNYSVSLSVEDAAGNNITEEKHFEYLEIAAFEIDTPEINFSGKSGSYLEVLGDHNMTTPNPTIRNIGNTQLDFEIRATDLNSIFDTIAVENMKYSFLDNDFESEYAGVLSKNSQRVNLGLNYGLSSLRELSIGLQIPQSATTGNYNGEIYLNAVA